MLEKGTESKTGTSKSADMCPTWVVCGERTSSLTFFQSRCRKETLEWQLKRRKRGQPKHKIPASRPKKANTLKDWKVNGFEMYNYPQKEGKVDENGLFLSYHHVSGDCLYSINHSVYDKKVSSNLRQKEGTVCCFKIPADAGNVPPNRMSGNHLFKKKTQVCVCVTFACVFMALRCCFRGQNEV